MVRTGPFVDLPAHLAAAATGDAMSVAGAASGDHTLLLVAAMLAVVALASIVGVIAARRQARDASRSARNRARSVHELLQTVRMAESVASLGVWQYDPATGTQQWSQGMRSLFGIEHDGAFVEGDAETLLYANDINLVGDVMRRASEREPYAITYDFHGIDGAPRMLSVKVCNLFGERAEVVRIIAVVRDLTDQMRRERDLEASYAVALQEAQSARRLAETDALTGLANRRRVMAELDRLILEARDGSLPLVLIVFDLDRFKLVNDTYGHLEGDKVLQRIAEIARRVARDTDLVGRVGGEEFVWIVPQATIETAQALADRLCEAIRLKSAVGNVPAVTASVGLAQMRVCDTSLTLFARADNALYAAKQSGRNQVKLAA